MAEILEQARALVAEAADFQNNSKHFQRIIDLGFPLELENWREH